MFCIAAQTLRTAVTIFKIIVRRIDLVICDRHNAKELLNGHSEVPVPGGFGAAGAPNDAWHQCHHAITRSFLRVAIAWSEFPCLRKRMEELEFSVQCQPATRCEGGENMFDVEDVCVYRFLGVLILAY